MAYTKCLCENVHALTRSWDGHVCGLLCWWAIAIWAGWGCVKFVVCVLGNPPVPIPLALFFPSPLITAYVLQERQSWACLGQWSQLPWVPVHRVQLRERAEHPPVGTGGAASQREQGGGLGHELHRRLGAACRVIRVVPL